MNSILSSRKSRGDGEAHSASNANPITPVVSHSNFSDRGLGLKVTSLHYRLLPRISNLGGPSFEVAQEWG